MLIAVFTAECLATNYAMIALPNIKIMDALVFIAAFLFGWTVGVGIAISTWTVYGFVNPYGQAGFPLILFLMMGECFYAIGGASELSNLGIFAFVSPVAILFAHRFSRIQRGLSRI